MTRLRTARVPDSLGELFVRAEQVVSEYFRHRADDPQKGTIEIAGERYVLVRAASLSVEFFALVEKLFGAGREEEARVFSQNILFDLAHALGKSDAKNFHDKMDLRDPAARLSAGPIHFAHSGWAFVDIDPSSNPQPNEDYFLLYEHPYSFESDAWLASDRSTTFPVCIMNAGYSSGWCEESFGLPLVASEILCKVRGDECCRFVMAPPEKIQERVSKYLENELGAEPGIHAYEIPDFFARKAMEEELREAHAELEARVVERTQELHLANQRLVRESAEREQMYQRLLEHQHLEALGRLAGGIAHDFNNLLGVIIGCGSMLRRRLPADSPEYAMLEQINEASEAAAHLTRQLVTFSRTEEADKHHHDLNDFLGTLEPMLRRIAGDSINMQMRLADFPAIIEANGSHLEQLLFNLTLNAKDAMPNGGCLDIETDEIPPATGTQGFVRLRLRDTGRGMTTHTKARAFDPFFSTKSTGTTSGLGLALVYSIVKSLNGTVEVESTPSEGCCFRIDLPLASSS